MLSRVKKQKENTELPRTSESVVKAGKVEISIKRGQKSELSIYDEAAGKSTKSQIPSNALKRIEPRVWSLDDFEMGSPLGVSVEKTSKKIVVINVAISMTTCEENLEHLVCYPEAEQGFQQVETEVIDAHLIGNPKRELDIREAISFLEKEDIKFWKHLKKTKHKHPISISSLEKSIFEYKDAAFPEPKQRNRLELTRGLN
ncbi:hypothetical protein RirG_220720 [Rhizophagus irregularis DAOM 197198w]|uniref:Uncharacterized protein n=1 Tax=Rhizophagus irregularis (strain DAOM 197198w) TaxID=1432141 RepID=A0A015JLX1_RHIIW|nr:hypothetical protein RirG_220720 [Rhizophagus irregularis DAOM 197198w]